VVILCVGGWNSEAGRRFRAVSVSRDDGVTWRLWATYGPGRPGRAGPAGREREMSRERRYVGGGLSVICRLPMSAGLAAAAAVAAAAAAGSESSAEPPAGAASSSSYSLYEWPP
jgi:hypothetical protein